MKIGYKADFGLRFVWVSAVSALDHYVTELIVERATEQFASGSALTPKMMGEGVRIEGALKLHGATKVDAILEFRSIVSLNVRYRTFQKADDISDGLSMIWNEKHKWDKISDKLGLSSKSAKSKLNNICSRRDRIVHNADFDEHSNKLTPCRIEDAKEVVIFISALANIIDAASA